MTAAMRRRVVLALRCAAEVDTDYEHLVNDDGYVLLHIGDACRALGYSHVVFRAAKVAERAVCADLGILDDHDYDYQMVYLEAAQRLEDGEM